MNEPRSLGRALGISLYSQGNIIVSPNGNILKTVGKGWLSLPLGCLCYEGKLFVSDFEKHVIKVYNSKGKFLYEFGRYGTNDGDLNQSAYLAMDKTGHLLVCCEGSHTVQVFTLDGKFVTKFGEYGKELGQFCEPSSALVLKSGRVRK